MRMMSKHGSHKWVALRRSWWSAIVVTAMVTLFALVGAACGGADPTATPTAVPAAAVAQPTATPTEYEAYIAQLVVGARAEGRLKVYSTHTEEPGVLNEEELFVKDYPWMQVEMVKESSNTRLKERMLLEMAAGRTPDIAGLSGNHLADLRDMHKLALYVSPLETAGLFRDEYPAVHHYWVPVQLRTLHNVFNTDDIKLEDLGDTHDEWLDPKYKQRVGIDIGGTFWQWWTALEKQYGVEEADAFMRKFAANEPMPFFSNTQIRNLVAAGELNFGNFIYLDNILIMQGRGAPIGMWNPTPGILTIGGFGIMAEAEHPNAARLFVEHRLSKAVQAERSEVTLAVPIRKDVAHAHPQYMSGDYVVVSSDDLVAAEDRQRATYEKYFRMKVPDD